jgi:hypothetical protein
MDKIYTEYHLDKSTGDFTTKVFPVVEENTHYFGHKIYTISTPNGNVEYSQSLGVLHCDGISNSMWVPFIDDGTHTEENKRIARELMVEKMESDKRMYEAHYCQSVLEYNRCIDSIEDFFENVDEKESIEL